MQINLQKPALQLYRDGALGGKRQRSWQFFIFSVLPHLPTLKIHTYPVRPALAMAFVHLFLFRYIDGKKADGPDRVAPQTYISTASNILANAFSFFLKSALTIAFVQHLWHLMRVQTMKISTIETLFGIKSNPLQIVTSAAIRSTPALCVISIIMSGMAIAASFPPGAINVISTQIISYQVVPVPTFNASFVSPFAL